MSAPLCHAAVLLAFSAVTIASSVPARAQLARGPCGGKVDNVITCGTGANAPIVLEGTTSPSGKLAIAWNTKSGRTEDFPYTEDVENHLVRLSDGRSLALLVGRNWDTGKAHGNHIYQTVAWSPDGRWLLVGDGGKWALEAIAIYAVDEAAASVKSLGLFRAISAAATRVLVDRIGRKKAEAYLLDIKGEPKIEITNGGAVSLPMLFQVPKEDKDVGLLVRFKASRDGDRVSLSPIGVSVVKR